MHCSVGALNAWLFALNSHIGWAFLIMFFAYEINEDWHLKDRAYIDLFGWLVGFPMFVIVRMWVLRYGNVQILFA